MNSTTTRQKSVYWGTADRVTTVINDTNLGYSIPTSVSSLYYVQDWDYQNLMPKSYLAVTTASPNPKFFMDLIWLDSSATAKVSAVGWGAWSYGSHLGRFHKSVYSLPTASGADASVRCAIISP